ncbi:MAG TPA: hypothetical protein DCG12_09065 [Planctomycetaceae bacterium]|nr:hypothetical protein [Planctomycetaceae bacterium]|tara:strand:- start:642 stop:863 length:222 start_codon:yes stop_codon:yes gene_type:complete
MGQAADTLRSPAQKSILAAGMKTAEAGSQNKVGNQEDILMAKTQRKLTKANKGRRPASAKARKLKRRHVKLSR